MPPGSVPEQPGKPHPGPFPGCAGNPGPAPACGLCRGAPVKSPPPNKKAMGLLRSMALIGLGIYGVAMRVDAGSSCWTFLGWEEPSLRPLAGLCGESRPAPACGSYPGRPGEVSPTQQKSHGALCSMALIGLGIYLAAMRVDAGSSCWAFLGWEEPSLCPPFQAVRGIPARARLRVISRAPR